MVTTALIGSPVEHSISPKLFQFYADEHGLDYAHIKCNVARDDLSHVIGALSAFGFSGVNVTQPYKTAVIQYLDIISSEAEAIGAVNTIVVRKGRLEGHNTDARGALAAIDRVHPRLLGTGDCAIVFGTGGAARAVTWGLLERGVEVSVVYREPKSSRTLSMMNDFKGRVRFITRGSLSIHNFKGITVLCNATSAGMWPHNEQTPVDLEAFQGLDLKGVVVFDAIFNPAVSKLQRWAKEHGAILASGIDMMIHQGVIAFEYWTGKKVGLETIRLASGTLSNFIGT